MKLFLALCLAALVAMAACKPLTATLTSVGNTAMQLVLTNTGEVDLNLVNRATILDKRPMQAVLLYTNNSAVSFQGVHYTHIRTGNLSADHFTLLPAGGSITVNFDAAAIYDLTAGGKFTAIAVGTIPYTEGGSTVLLGDVLGYKSNAIDINVNGVEAATVDMAINNIRSQFESLHFESSEESVLIEESCEGVMLNTMRKALWGHQGCFDQATMAAAEAEDATDAADRDAGVRFRHFFKTVEETWTKGVSKRLTDIATHCNSRDQGPVWAVCEDLLDVCDNLDLFSYSISNLKLFVICYRAFDELPATTNECLKHDVASCIIHELSHIAAVHTPVTKDFAKELKDVLNLDRDDAFLNAETYSFYVNVNSRLCPLSTSFVVDFVRTVEADDGAMKGRRLFKRDASLYRLTCVRSRW